MEKRYFVKIYAPAPNKGTQEVQKSVERFDTKEILSLARRTNFLNGARPFAFRFCQRDKYEWEQRSRETFATGLFYFDGWEEGEGERYHYSSPFWKFSKVLQKGDRVLEVS